MVVYGLTHALGGGRLGEGDYREGTAYICRAGGRKYASWPWCIQGASLAQRERVGIHHRSEAPSWPLTQGECRITVLDPAGGSFIDDLKKGDLWYFPTGFPHGIQGGFGATR